jgi:integrase
MCNARSSTPAADTVSLIWLGGPLYTACEDMLKSYGMSARGDLPSRAATGNCLMILVTTALRISEVAGLRVADIDLAGAY